MSAILEEGIGFGGNNTQSNQAPVPNPPPKTSYNDVTPVLKDIREVRQQKLEEAKTALENSFPPAVKSKAIQETEKLISTFRQKMADYPKCMSYEGSMVLCVLLSMKKVAAVSMRNIPSVDQALIRRLLPKEAEVSSFDVKFDDNKDFILIFNPTTSDHLTLTLFNTVAHPRPEDLVVNADVQVESQGDDIAVGGGKIKMNRKIIQRLFGHETSAEKSDSRDEQDDSPQRRPAATNRNAYEIRADVLQMAIDWARIEDSGGGYKKPSEDQLLQLARKFYSFVENRR